MALEAGPFMRIGTRGSPSWQRPSSRHAGYVCADCSSFHPIVACNRGGPYVCARCRNVGADDGAVEHQHQLRCRTETCKTVNKLIEHASLAQPVEAFPHAVPFAEAFGQGAPTDCITSVSDFRGASHYVAQALISSPGTMSTGFSAGGGRRANIRTFGQIKLDK